MAEIKYCETYDSEYGVHFECETKEITDHFKSDEKVVLHWFMPRKFLVMLTNYSTVIIDQHDFGCTHALYFDTKLNNYLIYALSKINLLDDQKNNGIQKLDLFMCDYPDMLIKYISKRCSTVPAKIENISWKKTINFLRYTYGITDNIFNIIKAIKLSE